VTRNGTHQPVMLRETLELLRPTPGQCVIDATVGYGGHGFEICKRLGESGTFIGIDQDEEAVEEAWTVLHTFPCEVKIVYGNFERIDELAEEVGIERVDSILFDLGVSSPQLDRPERGFSFTEGPLDMRMSRLNPTTAADFLASASRQEIARVLREYGDEKRAQSIARAIVDRRKTEPIRTTSQLRSLVHRCYKGVSHVGGIDSATRTFLAIRITVNRELECLQTGLERGWTLLEPGGRLIAISFHSGEHRIVKQFVRRRLGTCICPPGIPVCGCGARVEARSLVRGSIKPSGQEVLVNPRSRSAQLRAIERIEPDEE